MKFILFSFCCFILILNVKGQDIRRTFAVGLQASFPTYGLSAKYALTEQSVIQATIAPFSASSGGASESLNFYGARYIHRFVGDDSKSIILDPYLFAGGGLMTYKTNYTSFGGGTTSDSFFSYSLGGGIEWIIATRFGISAEFGYGKMGVTSGSSVSSLLGGGGFHFYIK